MEGVALDGRRQNEADFALFHSPMEACWLAMTSAGPKRTQANSRLLCGCGIGTDELHLRSELTDPTRAHVRIAMRGRNRPSEYKVPPPGVIQYI